MNGLRGAYRGQTATIVGKGPSILRLTRTDFGDGPVITINHAIIAVRRLGLSNPLYVMQKDGCVLHGDSRAPVPLGCVCPDPRMVPPVEPETVLLSAAESGRCFPDYPRRVVFDVERDFRLRWYTTSALVAARIAQAMGCTALRMLAMDAYTMSDTRRVDDGLTLLPGTDGYIAAGEQVDRYARSAGLAIEWVR